MSPLTSVRVQFAPPVRADTVTPKLFRLLAADGKPVGAEVNCDLTGGVATLTPVQQLAEDAAYTAELTADIQAADGGRLEPYRWTFRTGRQRVDGPQFRFAATEIDRAGQVTAVRVGPDGHLYMVTNGNRVGGAAYTLGGPGVPAVNARPHEFLARVVAGKYYGHPNPSCGELVLNGGNPTAGRDPWEVPAYPVGVKPDPRFDPALLYDLRPGGGNSANGLCEFPAAGPLQSRLTAAYFSGGRCVQAFAFDRHGNVSDERPLVGPDGRVLRFNQPVDVCADPRTGRVYLAVFGNWPGSRVGSGVESTGGGVWLLDPLPAGR